MARLRRAYSLFISVLTLTLLAVPATAQSLLPQGDGECAKFQATIEMQQGYVSGICVILRDGEMLNGSIFNEFGITAIDFTYRPSKGKVKLHSVLPMLNKWYIKRVLKSDLKKVMMALEQGDTSYENTRRHILYQFIPMNDNDSIATSDIDEFNEQYNEIPQ